jgi:hypothetical protein
LVDIECRSLGHKALIEARFFIRELGGIAATGMAGLHDRGVEGSPMIVDEFVESLKGRHS